MSLLQGLAPSLLEAWDYFVHLAVILIPLFIGASFLVGLAQAYLPPDRVEQILRRYDEGSGNVAAAGFGAVTPFCSCSTIPILTGLLQAGAPLGLAFSFLLASPLVNEIAVLLLLGLFGVKVTVVYVVVTFGAAVIGGFLIGRIGLDTHVKDVQLSTSGQPVADGGAQACCADAESGTVSAQSHRTRVRTAARDAREFFVDMFPYLLIGMTLGALIHEVIPVTWLRTLLGPENPAAVPLAAVAGAPVYISLSGMLPIAAAFVEQGIPIGTVLAFVVGGAGVSIPNVIMLNKLFDRTLLAVYVATVVAIGIVVGVLFNSPLL
jgi:uncharacterized membrane protein YraQ (UPF0718 family)